MSAPLRVSPVRSQAAANDGFKSYLDRLIKMIPAEVVGLYLVGIGLIPEEDVPVSVGWVVVCLIAVVVVRMWGTADPPEGLGPQWRAVAIASGAFLIWVYSMGRPFDDLGIHVSYIGSLLVLVWTFFVPIFYQGD